MKIPYPVAKILGRIAESEALNMEVPMAISLTGASGDPIYFGCMDKTLPASKEIAVSKAFTASILKMDTRIVGEFAQPGEPLYGIQNTHGGRIILFGGGLPLSIDGEVIGGIGISGGTVEEDERVAVPVQAAFDEMVVSGALIRKVLSGQSGKRQTPDVIDKIENLVKKMLPEFGEKNLGNHTALIITGAIILAIAS